MSNSSDIAGDLAYGEPFCKADEMSSSRRAPRARMGARYGGAPSETSPRLEPPPPPPRPVAGAGWRDWRGTDTYGYTIRLDPSGDGYRVHLRCVDSNGRGGYLAPTVGPRQEPPAGVTLGSYGGGFLDPRQARALAAALLEYADEHDGGTE